MTLPCHQTGGRRRRRHKQRGGIVGYRNSTNEQLRRMGIPTGPPPFFSQVGMGKRRRGKGQRGGIAPFILAALPFVAKAVAGGVLSGGAGFGVSKLLKEL